MSEIPKRCECGKLNFGRRACPSCRDLSASAANCNLIARRHERIKRAFQIDPDLPVFAVRERFGHVHRNLIAQIRKEALRCR